MCTLDYRLRLADNGILVDDRDLGSVNVFQERPDETTRQCWKRGIADTIAEEIAGIIGKELISQGAKDEYNIKIEIK